MSGWNPGDNWLEENSEYPMCNSITGPGTLPSDQIPAGMRSRNLVEAHFKSLKLFRKWCRYMPMIISWYGFRKYTTPEAGKLQLAAHFREQNKLRSVHVIDEMVRVGYERLYTIQQGDVWGTSILDWIHPVGHKGVIQNNMGYSFRDDVRFEGKSDFLQKFYNGGQKPNI